MTTSLAARIAREYGTPAAVIDLDRVERNIARVQVACRLLAQLGDNLECAKMNKTLIGLGAAVALLAIPAAASAYPARVGATVNLRSCGSTDCPIVTVLPAGALVDVRGTAGGWHYLTYGRFVGYASANYIVGGVVRRPPVIVRPPIVQRYPVYPSPYFYARPGVSLNFNFGFGDTRHRHH